MHCYDFGCKSTQELHYSDAQWRQIRAIFEARELDDVQEKQAIRQAVALMERISGELTGTHLDKAGNYPGYELPRQMDCIDESTNTFQYLLALEQLELLKWHRVDLKQHRIVWFIGHWTATRPSARSTATPDSPSIPGIGTMANCPICSRWPTGGVNVIFRPLTIRNWRPTKPGF